MQSPQARQRKLERKRLKREEKRRLQRLTGSGDGEAFLRPAIPKMSETLLEFAGPVLAVPDDAGPSEVRSCLLFAGVIWNAMVAARTDVDSVVRDLTPMVSKGLKISTEEASSLVRELANRKLERFPDDHRRVMDVETYWENGEVRILALSALEK
jgi:hypothetical protein